MFVCLRFTTGPQPLPEEALLADERSKEARSENFSFVNMETDRSEYNKLYDVSVRDARNVSLREKHFH